MRHLDSSLLKKIWNWLWHRAYKCKHEYHFHRIYDAGADGLDGRYWILFVKCHKCGEVKKEKAR